MEDNAQKPTTRRVPRRKKALQGLIAMAVSAVIALASIASFATSAFSATKGPAQEEPAKQTTTDDAKTQEKDEEAAEASQDEQEPADNSERDAFVAVWAERIDAFNAGYPLEGYGATFAAAAYDNGVDPRFAPAIARVESGSGVNCINSCNAWGWGAFSWSDWETAIWDYTAQLGQSYGHTLSYDAALSYNEENPDGWYEEVGNSMYAIYPDESL